MKTINVIARVFLDIWAYSWACDYDSQPDSYHWPESWKRAPEWKRRAMTQKAKALIEHDRLIDKLYDKKAWHRDIV